MRSRAWSMPDNHVMRIVSIAALVLLTSCASAPPQKTCVAGEEPAVTDALYVGTSIPAGGEVTAEQWQRFLAEVATPRFPNGFTTWTTAGQWQDASGKLWKEGGYVLQIVHPASERDEAAIREVMSIYRTRFGQEAVLRVRSPACMSFSR